MRYYCAYFSHCGYSEAPIIRTGHWQYIVCTAKLAYVPVHIIGTLEYVVKTQLILKNHFIPLWFDKNATGFATNIWNTAQCTLLDHIACIPVTVYHVTKPKPLTKFKRPKMKTDAWQKCSFFLVHSYFIRALIGIWKMTARGDRKIKTFFSFAVSPEIWKTTEELQTCSPIKSISFAKTHKTGSSTVQNIFLRYGWENNLTFVLPEKRTWMFGFKTQFRSGSSGYFSAVVLTLLLIIKGQKRNRGTRKMNLFTSLAELWIYDSRNLCSKKDSSTSLAPHKLWRL